MEVGFKLSHVWWVRPRQGTTRSSVHAFACSAVSEVGYDAHEDSEDKLWHRFVTSCQEFAIA